MMNLNKTLTTIILGFTLGMGCAENAKLSEKSKESVTLPEGFCLPEGSFPVLVEGVKAKYLVVPKKRTSLCRLDFKDVSLIDNDCNGSVEGVNNNYFNTTLNRKNLYDPDLFNDFDRKMDVGYITACENILAKDRPKVELVLKNISYVRRGKNELK